MPLLDVALFIVVLALWVHPKGLGNWLAYVKKGFDEQEKDND